MKKIYVTRDVGSLGIKKKKKYYRVILNKSSQSPSKKKIMRSVHNVDAILCTLSEKIDSDIMVAAGSNLRVISTYSTGYDHIDIKEATRRGIYVTTTGDILSEATADLTFALILALSRRLVEGHDYITSNKWNGGWMPNLLLGNNVYNSTLGIIGLGNIGSAVAKRARGFNINVLYHNRNQLTPSRERELRVKYVEKNYLLKHSDFLSIHTSLERDNFHLIDRPQLRLMKKTSFIINTSRGSVINEESLIHALKHKWISGAGLDVFESEPIPHTSDLLKMKNVILLPHLGSATIETRSKMSKIAAINIHNIFSRKKPFFLVNKDLKFN